MYPRMNSYPSIDESKLDKPKLLAFAGYKAGMLQVIAKDTTKGSATFGEDISVPVTVLDCPPIVAVGVRAYTASPSGLSIITEAWTDKLPKGFDLKRKSIKTKKKTKKSEKKKKEKEKRASASTQFAKMEKQLERITFVRLIVATQPKLAGFGKKTTDVFEIEIVGKSASDKLNFARDLLGKEIKPTDVLREGELVDTIAITKGKGTTGPVKRFGVVIQSRHAKGKRRHVGSLGQEEPGRVRWTVPMAGQMGFQQRTEFNKRVLSPRLTTKVIMITAFLRRFLSFTRTVNIAPTIGVIMGNRTITLNALRPLLLQLITEVWVCIIRNRGCKETWLCLR